MCVGKLIQCDSCQSPTTRLRVESSPHQSSPAGTLCAMCVCVGLHARACNTYSVDPHCVCMCQPNVFIHAFQRSRQSNVCRCFTSLQSTCNWRKMNAPRLDCFSLYTKSLFFSSRAWTLNTPRLFSFQRQWAVMMMSGAAQIYNNITHLHSRTRIHKNARALIDRYTDAQYPNTGNTDRKTPTKRTDARTQLRKAER